MPSVLWRCWVGSRKGIRPVKTERWGAVMVICLERGADLHMAQLMPLPLTVSCFSKIQIGFTFLVLAHLGSPRQTAVKRVCVCVCVCNASQQHILWTILESFMRNAIWKERHAVGEWPSRSWVIACWWGTYDFLLVFSCNCNTILREDRPHPCVCRLP